MYVSNGIIHTKDKLFPRNYGTRISTSSLSILILDSWASILDSRFSKVQKINFITFRVETVNLLFSGTVAMTNELTLEVQMTSLRFMFIQLSQLTRWPLYVSPFFSSTSCKEKKNASTSAISAYDKVGLIRSTSVSTKCKKTIVTNVHATIPSANIFLGIYKLEHECTRLFTTFLCKLHLNSQISRK